MGERNAPVAVPAESVVGEDFVEARGVDHPVGPGFRFLAVDGAIS